MKFAVTGGAGFIGSNLMRQLSQTNPDSEILNIDNLSYCGDESRLADITSDKITLCRADIAKKSEYLRVLEGTDVLFHFAA